MNFSRYAVQLVCCYCVLAALCGCIANSKSADVGRKPQRFGGTCFSGHNQAVRGDVSNVKEQSTTESVNGVDLARKRADVAVKEEEAKKLREKSEKGWLNEEALKEFALRESPSLWKTVLAIRAQVATRRTSLAQLKSELLEFNLNPENDADYVRLQKDIDSMLDGLAGIFKHIEEAYIAAKKREADFGNGYYDKAMKRALKDGIAGAEGIANRYREMKQSK
jgi:hypothetical protein